MTAIMREWTSARSFTERTNRLDAGIADPVLGLLRLKPSTAPGDGLTVLDDLARDVLFGGSDSDWFFDFPLDRAKDRGLRDRSMTRGDS